MKNREQKKAVLSTIKNVRNENDSDAMNLTNKVVFNKDSKSIDIFNVNVAMKKISIDINLNSRAIKYKKTKQIKFTLIEIVEISKRLKKLTQMIKEQFDFVNVIK